MSNSNQIKIKINSSLRLLAGTILQPDRPTLESIKDDIFGVVFNDDYGVNLSILEPLVRAYLALLDEAIEEECLSGENPAIVSDHDDYAAERLYRKYCIRGWREAVKVDYPDAASRDDSDVYDGCPWYEFGRMVWPAQLVAEIGYVNGYRAGRDGVAMTRYAKQELNKGS